MKVQIENLWGHLTQKEKTSPCEFSGLVEKLVEASIPEILNLAVIISQRIFAIAQVQSFIENGNNPAALQYLIETFPWLLGYQWEKLTSNKSIRKLCLRIEQSQSLKREDKHQPENIPQENLRIQPNFVFLSDRNGQKDIVVFGLKGAKAEEELSFDEYKQLRGYLDTIQESKREALVKGILVGHRKGSFQLTDTRIEVATWQEILVNARRGYLDYLESLLAFPNAITSEDKRIKTVRNFGDDEVKRLLDSILSNNKEPIESRQRSSQNENLEDPQTLI